MAGKFTGESHAILQTTCGQILHWHRVKLRARTDHFLNQELQGTCQIVFQLLHNNGVKGGDIIHFIYSFLTKQRRGWRFLEK